MTFVVSLKCNIVLLQYTDIKHSFLNLKILCSTLCGTSMDTIIIMVFSMYIDIFTAPLWHKDTILISIIMVQMWCTQLLLWCNDDLDAPRKHQKEGIPGSNGTSTIKHHSVVTSGSKGDLSNLVPLKYLIGAMAIMEQVSYNFNFMVHYSSPHD